MVHEMEEFPNTLGASHSLGPCISAYYVGKYLLYMQQKDNLLVS